MCWKTLNVGVSLIKAIPKTKIFVASKSKLVINIFKVDNGLRIAQMVLCPVIEAKLSEVEIIDETERGEGGFGSTGTKWLV